ncbi:hypothetical protein B5F10_16580 [Anaerotruncus colihominis]|uniref:Uncharacterized protein n=1 Tax=Anaerotruncus colihominis TaxID=169435 RepID=A0A1Y4MTJ5_9FIRM|nr:hypothetical protein B5F11_07120 [Anaerotruncus colihominis]OUP72027.1 hypothetical protein B5F10_16580 [Anaerotruncus colihominis]
MNAAPAPQFAAQPVSTQRPPHCSRRSRLKFFAPLFFKKAGAQPIKVFRRGLFSKRPDKIDHVG